MAVPRELIQQLATTLKAIAPFLNEAVSVPTTTELDVWLPAKWSPHWPADVVLPPELRAESYKQAIHEALASRAENQSIQKGRRHRITARSARQRVGALMRLPRPECLLSFLQEAAAQGWDGWSYAHVERYASAFQNRRGGASVPKSFTDAGAPTT